MDDKEKEEAKFLVNDFGQSFQQMRHYDNQISNILKFSFTAYTALIGISLGLFEYGIKYTLDFRIAIIAALVIGFILGILNFSLIIRNRAYYILTARYVNEIRKHFLNKKPLDFENLTKMYTDFTQPPYFNWRSSQSLMVYIIAILNGTLLGLIIYFAGCTNIKNVYIFIGFVLIVIIQLLFGIVYLKSRENKSAEKAIFGKASKQ